VSRESAKITVSGFVQGVGYRYFAVDSAVIFDIKGYVRNVEGGKVEAVAEGEKRSIDSFIEKLKQGPYSATVSDVEVAWFPYSGQYSGFGIK
jgi:acylphosphatase